MMHKQRYTDMGKGKGSPRIEEKENSSSGDSHKTHEIWFKERGFFFFFCSPGFWEKDGLSSRQNIMFA